MADFATLRLRMDDNQIRPGAVTDLNVIKAFLEVPRESFVASAQRPFAYADHDLRLPASPGAERFMMPPVQLARLIQALPYGPDAKAMVVGCGTGYSAAILAQLAGRIVAVEEDAALIAGARGNLHAWPNILVVEGKLADGCPAEAPYDAILVDGAIEVLPNSLLSLLKPQGILAAIERDDRISRAVTYERVGAEATKWPLFEAWAGALPGFARKREFVF